MLAKKDRNISQTPHSTCLNRGSKNSIQENVLVAALSVMRRLQSISKTEKSKLSQQSGQSVPNPMKLIYVNPQSYHNLSKYDAGILSQLSEWDRHYVCSFLLDYDLPIDISIHKFFIYNHKKSNFARACSYVRSLVYVLRLIRRVGPNVLHVQWVKIPIVDYLFLGLARRLTACKIIFTAHNVVPHNQGDRRHFGLGCIYSLVDLILVHEPAAARSIQEKFQIRKSKFRVVRHGRISLENKGQRKFSSEIEEFFGSSGLNMCFFGRGSIYKGLDILLEAWSQFSIRRNDQARLLIIGKLDDDVRHIVTGLALDRQNLRVIDEFVSEADLYAAVSLSDVLIFPYREISQSGALLSVLEFGKPIIVSNCNGLTEPLEIGDIGWVFDGSAESLAELIAELIDDPNLVSDRRDDRHAWRAVNAYYSWRAVGPDIRAAYGGLLVDKTSA